MEKLIKLLDKYDGNNHQRDYSKEDLMWEDEGNLILQVISNKFGFIKWLVEKEEIDLNKIPHKLEGYYDETVEYIQDEASILLMELAIQDEPIEFLVSILK